MIKILLIEPDRQVHDRLRELLPPICTAVSHFRGAGAGETVRNHRPAAVIVGLDIPDRPAGELVSQITGFPDAPQVVGIAHGGQARDVVRIMRSGAADCLVRPFGPREVREALARVVELPDSTGGNETCGNATYGNGTDETSSRVIGSSAPDLLVAGTHHESRHEDEAERLLRGGSKAIRGLRDFIRRVADSDKPVLFLGESGSGKEMAAQAVHQLSTHPLAPFAAANCSAIPESLFETEMFGSERGAYTDAVAKAGHLERAGSGTVFLDEIGEMSPFNQAKMLRVLEERAVRRVGGTRDIPLAFRVVAASNRNLPQDVSAGRFRADLFYRLSVLTYFLPSLQDRVEDIPELAVRFLEESGLADVEIADNALDRLCGHPWPGNVRELRNVIDRAAVLRHGSTIRAEDISFV